MYNLTHVISGEVVQSVEMTEQQAVDCNHSLERDGKWLRWVPADESKA